MIFLKTTTSIKKYFYNANLKKSKNHVFRESLSMRPMWQFEKRRRKKNFLVRFAL